MPLFGSSPSGGSCERRAFAGHRYAGLVAVACMATLLAASPTLAAPPTLTCPPAVSVECTSPNGTPATLTAQVNDPDGGIVQVTWRVDNVQVKQENVAVPGTSTLVRNYSLGPHTVIVTASDGTSRVNCTITVTVVDTTPPVVRAAVAIPSLWPPNHNLVNVGLQAVARDICDPNPTLRVSAFSNEDDLEATGEGNFSPDAKFSRGVLRLRSERKGNGAGRVYLILVTATDMSGNTGFACTTVVIPHDQGRRSGPAVQRMAAAALAQCDDFLDFARGQGALPAGFFVVGDGPTVGPKQ